MCCFATGVPDVDVDVVDPDVDRLYQAAVDFQHYHLANDLD